MDRNIKIAYILSFLKYSWFWIGIWIFFYLRYTTYAGIGLIETVMIATMVLSEIPTGALGDLLGKRKTLFLAFLLEGVGNLLVALSNNFTSLIFSIALSSFGGTMYSGTAEALVYDSLKQNGKEDKFAKVVANLSSFQWIAVTATGIFGGILYTINPAYPFFASGSFLLMGAILTIFIKEPKVDSEKFSLKTFLIQNKIGVQELFKNKETTNISILLIAIGAISIIFWEMLEGVLGVEFGFSPLGLSVFSAILYLITAAGSQFTSFFQNKFGGLKAIIILTIIASLSLLVSPFAGIILGGATLIIRSVTQVISDSLTSVLINRNTDSKYRAVTISSFSMIKNIPYLVSAYALGVFMDIVTGRVFAFSLGILMIVVTICWIVVNRNKKLM